MLKSVLALLLSKFVKRSDTEFIAHQSAPDGWGRRILLKDNVKGTFEGQYTAPTNGYLCVDAGTGIVSLNATCAVHSRIHAASSTLNWPQVYTPIKKGAVGVYNVTASGDTGDGSSVYFVPMVGC